MKLTVDDFKAVLQLTLDNALHISVNQVRISVSIVPFRAYYVQSINACNLLSCCHESHSHAVPVYLREHDVLWYNQFLDRIAHQLIHFDLVEDQV